MQPTFITFKTQTGVYRIPKDRVSEFLQDFPEAQKLDDNESLSYNDGTKEISNEKSGMNNKAQAPTEGIKPNYDSGNSTLTTPSHSKMERNLDPTQQKLSDAHQAGREQAEQDLNRSRVTPFAKSVTSLGGKRMTSGWGETFNMIRNIGNKDARNQKVSKSELNQHFIDGYNAYHMENHKVAGTFASVLQIVPQIAGTIATGTVTGMLMGGKKGAVGGKAGVAGGGVVGGVVGFCKSLATAQGMIRTSMMAAPAMGRKYSQNKRREDVEHDAVVMNAALYGTMEGVVNQLPFGRFANIKKWSQAIGKKPFTKAWYKNVANRAGMNIVEEGTQNALSVICESALDLAFLKDTKTGEQLAKEMTVAFIQGGIGGVMISPVFGGLQSVYQPYIDRAGKVPIAKDSPFYAKQTDIDKNPELYKKLHNDFLKNHLVVNHRDYKEILETIVIHEGRADLVKQNEMNMQHNTDFVEGMLEDMKLENRGMTARQNIVDLEMLYDQYSGFIHKDTQDKLKTYIKEIKAQTKEDIKSGLHQKGIDTHVRLVESINDYIDNIHIEHNGKLTQQELEGYRQEAMDNIQNELSDLPARYQDNGVLQVYLDNKFTDFEIVAEAPQQSEAPSQESPVVQENLTTEIPPTEQAPTTPADTAEKSQKGVNLTNENEKSDTEAKDDKIHSILSVISKKRRKPIPKEKKTETKKDLTWYESDFVNEKNITETDINKKSARKLKDSQIPDKIKEIDIEIQNISNEITDLSKSLPIGHDFLNLTDINKNKLSKLKAEDRKKIENLRSKYYKLLKEKQVLEQEPIRRKLESLEHTDTKGVITGKIYPSKFKNYPVTNEKNLELFKQTLDEHYYYEPAYSYKDKKTKKTIYVQDCFVNKENYLLNTNIKDLSQQIQRDKNKIWAIDHGMMPMRDTESGSKHIVDFKVNFIQEGKKTPKTRTLNIDVKKHLKKRLNDLNKLIKKLETGQVETLTPKQHHANEIFRLEKRLENLNGELDIILKSEEAKREPGKKAAKDSEIKETNTSNIIRTISKQQKELTSQIIKMKEMSNNLPQLKENLEKARKATHKPSEIKEADYFEKTRARLKQEMEELILEMQEGKTIPHRSRMENHPDKIKESIEARDNNSALQAECELVINKLQSLENQSGIIDFHQISNIEFSERELDIISLLLTHGDYIQIHNMQIMRADAFEIDPLVMASRVRWQLRNKIEHVNQAEYYESLLNRKKQELADLTTTDRDKANKKLPKHNLKHSKKQSDLHNTNKELTEEQNKAQEKMLEDLSKRQTELTKKRNNKTILPEEEIELIALDKEFVRLTDLLLTTKQYSIYDEKNNKYDWYTKSSAHQTEKKDNYLLFNKNKHDDDIQGELPQELGSLKEHQKLRLERDIEQLSNIVYKLKNKQPNSFHGVISQKTNEGFEQSRAVLEKHFKKEFNDWNDVLTYFMKKRNQTEKNLEAITRIFDITKASKSFAMDSKLLDMTTNNEGGTVLKQDYDYKVNWDNVITFINSKLIDKKFINIPEKKATFIENFDTVCRINNRLADQLNAEVDSIYFPENIQTTPYDENSSTRSNYKRILQYQYLLKSWENTKSFDSFEDIQYFNYTNTRGSNLIYHLKQLMNNQLPENAVINKETGFAEKVEFQNEVKRLSQETEQAKSDLNNLFQRVQTDDVRKKGLELQEKVNELNKLKNYVNLSLRIYDNMVEAQHNISKFENFIKPYVKSYLDSQRFSDETIKQFQEYLDSSKKEADNIHIPDTPIISKEIMSVPLHILKEQADIFYNKEQILKYQITVLKDIIAGKPVDKTNTNRKIITNIADESIGKLEVTIKSLKDETEQLRNQKKDLQNHIQKYKTEAEKYDNHADKVEKYKINKKLRYAQKILNKHQPPPGIQYKLEEYIRKNIPDYNKLSKIQQFIKVSQILPKLGYQKSNIRKIAEKHFYENYQKLQDLENKYHYFNNEISKANKNIDAIDRELLIKEGEIAHQSQIRNKFVHNVDLHNSIFNKMSTEELIQTAKNLTDKLNQELTETTIEYNLCREVISERTNLENVSIYKDKAPTKLIFSAQNSLGKLPADTKPVEINTPSKLTEKIDTQEVIAEKERLVKFITNEKAYTRNWWRDAFVPIMDRVKRLSPEIYYQVRVKWEYPKRTSSVLHRKEACKPFFEAFNKLPENDKDLATSILLNAPTDTGKKKLREIFAQNNMMKEYEAMRKVMDMIKDEGVKAGYQIGYYDDYCPRIPINTEFDGNMSLSDYSNYKTRKYARVNKKEFLSPIEAISRYIEVATTKNQLKAIFGEGNHLYKIKSIHAYTDKDGVVRNSWDINTSDLISNLIRQHKVPPKNRAELRDMLNIYFNPTKHDPTISFIKNLTNICLITTPHAALTQIDDLAVAFCVDAGIACKELKKALPGVLGKTMNENKSKSDIKLHEVGGEGIGAEYINQGSLAKFANTMFNLSGFAGGDRVGKQTIINSYYQKYVDKATNDSFTKRELTELQAMFGNDYQKVINDFKTGKISDDVKAFCFIKLSEVQPLSHGDTPYYFVKHPRSRLFYQYKTFMLRRANHLVNRVKEGYKHGYDTPEGKQAVYELCKLMAWFALCGVTMQALRDLWFGRETDLWKNARDTGLAYATLSSYQWNQFKRGNYVNLGLSTVPATAPFKNMARDIMDERSILDKPVSAQHIPLIGREYHWRAGRGKEWIDHSKRRSVGNLNNIRGSLVKDIQRAGVTLPVRANLIHIDDRQLNHKESMEFLKHRRQRFEALLKMNEHQIRSHIEKGNTRELNNLMWIMNRNANTFARERVT